jgi:hypothetical protein
MVPWRAEATHDVIKLSVEFDETGQYARLRKNIIEVEGTFPVMVQSLLSTKPLRGTQCSNVAQCYPLSVLMLTCLGCL